MGCCAFRGASRPRACIRAIAVTLSVFAVREARAEVRYDADSRADAVASRLVFDHTVGAGADRVLLVAVVLEDGAARVSSVRSGGTGLSAVGSVGAPAGACRVELWRRTAPASGRQTIDVQLASGTHVYAVAISYSGVDQANPTSAAATNSGTGDTATVSLPSATDDVAVDWVCAGGGNVVVGGPALGQTRRDSWGGDPAGGVSERPGDSPTVAMTWRTVGSFAWATGAIALHPATAATDGGAGDGATGNGDGATSDLPAMGDANESDGGSPDGGVPIDADVDPRIDGGVSVKLAVGCACEAGGRPVRGTSAFACGLLLLLATRRRRR
jgi:hypothetical protein